LALWSVGGLETSIVALLLTAATLQLAREDSDDIVAAAWLLAPLPWLRPEALAVAGALVLAAHALRPWRRSVLRSLVVALAPVLISQALLQLVRWVIYGNVVPNSALYKVGTGGAFDVPLEFLQQNVVIVVAAVLGAVLLSGRQRVLLVPPVVYVLGSVNTLDSANGWSRFLVPVLPQLALVGGVLVAAVLVRVGLRQWWAAGAVAAALAASALTWQPASLPPVNAWQRAYTDCKVAVRHDMSAWLRTTPPETVFAISDAGLVPARAGGRTAIDSFLLNEAVLQETGAMPPDGRAERVHAQEPHVLVLASTTDTDFDGVYQTDQLIRDHPAAADYTLRHVSTAGPDCGYSLWAYQR
jgi:hypothetical protein